jgi:CHAT domain-containing protein
MKHCLEYLTLMALLIPVMVTMPAQSIQLNPKMPVFAQTPDARKTQADQLFQQGLQAAQINQFEAAIQAWQQALKLYQEINDRQSELNTLGNLANVYFFLSDYPQAIEYYQQALTIAQEAQNRQSEGLIQLGLGINYFRLGNYPKAIESQQQALVVVRETNNRQGEARVLGNLGNIYLSLGNYPQAIEYYQQVLEISQEIQDRQTEGKAFGNLGTIYYFLEQYPQAIDSMQQALTIAQEIQDRQTEAQALGQLGNFYLALGDNPKALNHLQQWLIMARDIQDRQSEASALGALGAYYLKQENYLKAIEHQQQWLKISREIQNRPLEGKALDDLGYTFFKQGNLTEATQTLMAGIEVIESLRSNLEDANKVSIFEQQRNIYTTLQQVLIAQNQIDAALEISERGRARAFVELLIEQLSPEQSQQLIVSPPHIEKLQAVAKTHQSTLVQYSVIEDSELYIWVIKPTGEIAFRRSDLQSILQEKKIKLADLVYSSRDSIGVRGLGLVARTGSQRKLDLNQNEQLQILYQLLIVPIADLLPKNPENPVVFIPQNELFLVPFAALQNSTGTYLVENHTILIAPSIQILEATRQQRETLKEMEDILIVGNPKMPSLSPEPGMPAQPLPSLPGAEKEALTIAQLLNTKAITGTQATETFIVQKMPAARMIHFATHGLLNDFGFGVPGAIALAPEGNNDESGFLTASEIFNLKLNAELVVLSACDTGRGQITGDGVIGLSRSFMGAGVPSVIVSLWSVPDAPTAGLMTNFYQNLQKNPNKASALRQAMLTTKQEYPNPRDWAAFMLMGEAE